MDDTGLLRDLAHAAREEEADERDRWDRWDRLTDDALSPEEEAELLALAARSVEDKMAFEAFRPLSPDFRARMVATIGPLVGKAAAPAEVSAVVEAPVREERPRAVQEEKSRHGFTFSWWRVAFAGPGLAGVAAALFFALRLPPLPQYAVADVKPGVEISRGDGEREVVPALVSGETFMATARPKVKISSRARVEPLCYVLPTKPTAKWIRSVDCAPESEPDKRGSMKIHGRLPDDLTTGPAILWIVLAYRGDQPEADEIEKLPTDRPTRRRKWDAEPTPIEIRSP